MPILGIGNYKFEPYHLVFLFLMSKKFRNNKKSNLTNNILISNKKYLLELGHDVDKITADSVTNQIRNGFLLKNKTFWSGPHYKNLEWFSELGINQGSFTSAINLHVNAAIKFINEIDLPSLCRRYEKWKNKNKKIFAEVKDKSAWQILDSRDYCNSTEKHGGVIVLNQWNEKFIIMDTNLCGKKAI